MSEYRGLLTEIDQRAVDLISDRMFNRLHDYVSRHPGADPLPMLSKMLKALGSRFGAHPLQVIRLAVLARMQASDACLIVDQVDLSIAAALREKVAEAEEIR